MKIKQHLYISSPDDFLSGHYRHCFQVVGVSRLDNHWINLGEIEIDVNVDKGDVTKTVLAAIDAEETKVREEFELKISLLERKRQEILCLEMDK